MKVTVDCSYLGLDMHFEPSAELIVDHAISALEVAGFDDGPREIFPRPPTPGMT